MSLIDKIFLTAEAHEKKTGLVSYDLHRRAIRFFLRWRRQVNDAYYFNWKIELNSTNGSFVLFNSREEKLNWTFKELHSINGWSKKKLSFNLIDWIVLLTKSSILNRIEGYSLKAHEWTNVFHNGCLRIIKISEQKLVFTCANIRFFLEFLWLSVNVRIYKS